VFLAQKVEVKPDEPRNMASLLKVVCELVKGLQFEEANQKEDLAGPLGRAVSSYMDNEGNQVVVFSGMTSCCSPVGGYQYFRGKCCLNLQG
jgi:hypothetical protein